MTSPLTSPWQSHSQRTRTTDGEVEEWEQVPVVASLAVVDLGAEDVAEGDTTKGMIIAGTTCMVVVAATMMAVATTVTMVAVVVTAGVTTAVVITVVEVMVEVMVEVDTVVATTPVVEEGQGVVREVLQGVVKEVEQEEAQEEVGQGAVEPGEVDVVAKVVLADLALEVGAHVVVQLEEEELVERQEGMVHRSANLVVMAIKVVVEATRNQRGHIWITAARSMGSRNSGVRSTATETREINSGTKTPGHSSSGSDQNPDWKPFNLFNQINCH